MADFVEKQHLGMGVGVFTCILDGLITALTDDVMGFPFQVGKII